MRYFFSWWRLNLPLIWDPPDPSFSLLILYCFPFCLGCFISASVVAFLYYSVQFSHSVVYNSATPMDCSTPGFPVHHQLPELAQTHVHPVSDAIEPSHPLWCPSPPAFNLPQHQSLFQQVSLSHQVAKELEFQLQHQSFQWIFRTDFL